MMNQCLRSRKRCQGPTKIATCDQPVSVRKAAGVFTGGFPRQTEQRWTKPEWKVSPFPLCTSILVPSENTGNHSGLRHVIFSSILTGEITHISHLPRRSGVGEYRSCGKAMQQHNKSETVKMSTSVIPIGLLCCPAPFFLPPPRFLTLWITDIPGHPLDSNPNPPSPAKATCICLSSLVWGTACCGGTIFGPFGDCNNAKTDKLG